MGHDHSHNHNSSEKNLFIVFIINILFTIIEFIGGYFVNSIAIVSDAIHDFGDTISLGLAWYLEKKSKKEANQEYTFGYARFSLLGALINSIILIIGGVFMIYKAIDRIIHPEYSDAEGMLYLAILGVIVNGFAFWKLSKGESMNEKVISWHLIEDMLGWVAVLVVSIILRFYKSPYLDPVLSIFITFFILYGVSQRLNETLRIFLQATPRSVPIEEIKTKILALPYVESIHYIHVWSMEGQQNVFTGHIKLKHIDEMSDITKAKIQIRDVLKNYDIQHITIETELEDEPDHD